MARARKAGLTGAAEPARTAADIGRRQALFMWESGLLDTLTAGSFAALAAIHKKLFAEIDDLAGQLRTVNLGRGNGHFIPALELRAALVHIERMPQAGLDDILAKYLAMNLVHPFPRGNGRSMRIWLDLMLKRELGRARNLPRERGYKGAQHARAKDSPKAQIQGQQGPADGMRRSAPCARLFPPPGAQLRQTSAPVAERSGFAREHMPLPQKGGIANSSLPGR